MKEKIVVRSNLKDFSNFLKIPDTRKTVINQALSTPLKKNYAVNSTASFLHPDVQYLKVREVIEISRDERCFILVPDSAHGTGKLAFFRPGQYLSITLKIGNAIVTRPYTICSSPYDSSDGDFYMIYVKKVIHGFASQYIFNNWVKGTEVEASAPLGEFYYQPLRDSKTIVAITDSDGVSGFLSMAKAINEGSLKMNLTLLYSCRNKNDAPFMEELQYLQHETNNFNVAFVFSDEKVDNNERGFITKQLIEKYAPNERYSIFVNGSPQLLSLIATQISEMNFERKDIRVASLGEIKDSHTLPDFPMQYSGKEFQCKVKKDGKVIATIPCIADETLLVALERAGMPSQSHCRSGKCGFCRARLTKGNVFIPNSFDSRRLADIKHGIIHPCSSYPMSDVTVVI